MESGRDLSPPDHCISSSWWTDRRTDGSERRTKHFLFLFMTTVQSASHVEPQVIGPLADDTVTRVAVIGHLELEDVVAAGSISVLVEQNTRTGTSCWEHRGTEA